MNNMYIGYMNSQCFSWGPNTGCIYIFGGVQIQGVYISGSGGQMYLMNISLQVLKVQVKDKVPQFLVHYSGWNKTYDGTLMSVE